jgi:stearoyl-CoA desaturase (delta-9 desaturase)
MVYGIILHVFAHVCALKARGRLNRIIGEVAGCRADAFASWEVVHQRHHRFATTSTRIRTPACRATGRTWHTIVNVERQLQQTYFDLYGDTPENHAYEKRRAYVSYATNILVISAFFLFLGPVAFFVFFAPASILAAFHLVHFNWSTHNAQSPTADYHPVNLNHGYFKLGNKLFFGIYMHANHHKWPNVLNPAHSKVKLPIEPAPTAETEAARARLKKTWDYSARPAVSE